MITLQIGVRHHSYYTPTVSLCQATLLSEKSTVTSGYNDVSE